MAKFEATLEQREVVAELAGYGAAVNAIGDAIGVSGTAVKHHFGVELRRKTSGRAVPVADDPTHPYQRQAATVRERYAGKATGRRNTRPRAWHRARA